MTRYFGRRARVLLADPPWRFETYSEKGRGRAAENHYRTMTLEEIQEYRPPLDWTASDCVCFLWATAPMLPHAISVLYRWNFEYKSCAVWPKSKIGTGYWFRNQHEILLLGTRGKVHAPPPDRRPSSLIPGESRRHSEKPDSVHAFIEGMLEGPYLELFGRKRRSGWTVVGDELAGRSVVGD